MDKHKFYVKYCDQLNVDGAYLNIEITLVLYKEFTIIYGKTPYNVGFV